MAKIIQEVDRGNEKVYPITVTNAVMGEGDEGKLSEIIQGLKNRLDKLESNPNLLDNSNFKNPINQRMEESYIGQWEKGIDRWVIIGNYDVLTHTLTFDAEHQTSRFGLDAISYMRQGLEKLDSGKYTISAGVGDTVYSQTISVFQGGSVKAWNMGPFYFTYEKYVGVDVQWFGFGVTPGESGPGSIALDWIKLEQGDKATPYVPKGYGQELSECLRYYQTIAFSVGLDRATYKYIPTLIPMRTTPTCTLQQIAASGTLPAISTSNLYITANLATPQYFDGFAFLSADL